MHGHEDVRVRGGESRIVIVPVDVDAAGALHYLRGRRRRKLRLRPDRGKKMKHHSLQTRGLG